MVWFVTSLHLSKLYAYVSIYIYTYTRTHIVSLSLSSKKKYIYTKRFYVLCYSPSQSRNTIDEIRVLINTRSMVRKIFSENRNERTTKLHRKIFERDIFNEERILSNDFSRIFRTLVEIRSRQHVSNNFTRSLLALSCSFLHDI